MSPFNLSQTLPVGGGLLVPCSLSGSPVIKQLMEMVTMVPGQGGGFSVLPLTVVAQKQTYRSMEQDSKLREKPKYLWSSNLWQRRQEYTMGKRQSLQ